VRQQLVELLACSLRGRYSRLHGDASSCRRRQPARLELNAKQECIPVSFSSKSRTSPCAENFQAFDSVMGPSFRGLRWPQGRGTRTPALTHRDSGSLDACAKAACGDLDRSGSYAALIILRTSTVYRYSVPSGGTNLFRMLRTTLASP